MTSSNGMARIQSAWTQSPEEQIDLVSGFRQNRLGTTDWADMMDDDNPENLIVEAGDCVEYETFAERLERAREDLLRSNPHLRKEFVFPSQLQPGAIARGKNGRFTGERYIGDFDADETSDSGDGSAKYINYHPMLLLCEAAVIANDAEYSVEGHPIRDSQVTFGAPDVNETNAMTYDVSEFHTMSINDLQETTASSEPETNSVNNTEVNPTTSSQARPTDTASAIPSCAKTASPPSEPSPYERSKPHPSGKSWEWIDEWGDPLNPEPLMEFTAEENQRAREPHGDHPKWRRIESLRRLGYLGM